MIFIQELECRVNKDISCYIFYLHTFWRRKQIYSRNCVRSQFQISDFIKVMDVQFEFFKITPQIPSFQPMDLMSNISVSSTLHIKLILNLI